jgi:hypothetical protein
MLKAIPKEYHDNAKGTLKLLWEEEWRGLGITQVRAKSCEEGKYPLKIRRVSDGSTTKYMSRSLIFYSSSMPLSHPRRRN